MNNFLSLILRINPRVLARGMKAIVDFCSGGSPGLQAGEASLYRLKGKGRFNVFFRLVILFFAFILSEESLFAQEKSKVINDNAKAVYEQLYKGEYKDYNVIMISINNIGIAHMSLYGYERKTTVNLDNWAKGAFVFEDMFSPASWTLPVATSLFTSLYPYTHKVVDRYKLNVLNKEIITLPELLRKNNYKTAAFTGGLDYSSAFGHMRGFEDIDSNSVLTGFSVTLLQAKEWLAKNSKNKFFLFLHGYDAHPPFTPPENFKGIFSNIAGRKITVDNKICIRGYKNSDGEYVAYKLKLEAPMLPENITRKKTNKVAADNKVYANNASQERTILYKKEIKEKFILTQDDIDYLRDLYDEEVLSVDNLVSDFLNSLDKKLLKKTIIIIFSEHGEMFAKHGRFGRTGAVRGTLYEEVTHVPLLMKIPEKPGRRIHGITQIIDIMPTILDMLDISFPEKIQGKSLLALINNNNFINEYAFAGLEFNVNRPVQHPYYAQESINESIRDAKYKLIHEIIFADSGKKQNKISQESFELYDLENDPQELKNISDTATEQTRKLKEKLKEWRGWAKSFFSLPPSTGDVGRELLEEARKHGYW